MNASLKNLLETSPLFERDSSLEGLSGDESEGSAIYFGTGLTTASAASVGVPFDALAMILLAEKVRRILNWEKVHHLIADVHALTNSFVEDSQVEMLRRKWASIISGVTRTFCLEGSYNLVLGSDIAKTDTYLDFYRNIPAVDDHEYVRREWADVAYMQEVNNVGLKLSWAVGPRTKKVGFDERLYDLRYSSVTGRNITFLYTKPGRTFDANRPKVSPYICVPGESRIRIEPSEDVEKKLHDAKDSLSGKLYDSAESHLTNVANLAAEFFDGELWDAGAALPLKISSVIDRIVQNSA